MECPCGHDWNELRTLIMSLTVATADTDFASFCLALGWWDSGVLPSYGLMSGENPCARGIGMS